MRPIKSLLAPLLIAAMTLHAVVAGPAQAGMVATGDVLAAETTASPERERVNTFIGREDVRQELRNLGVDPDEAAARVEALSDAEIAQIAARMDELPAGQDAIGAIVGAAVLIFLVLLITDILCLTSVFNFTRCAR